MLSASNPWRLRSGKKEKGNQNVCCCKSKPIECCRRRVGVREHPHSKNKDEKVHHQGKQDILTNLVSTVAVIVGSLSNGA